MSYRTHCMGSPFTNTWMLYHLHVDSYVFSFFFILFVPHVLSRFLYHCVQTINHTLRFGFAYLLMLIVMTYNAWFLVAIVGGAIVGYFLFSADLLMLAARTESAAINMRMRRRRLENVRPQTFYNHWLSREDSWKNYE